MGLPEVGGKGMILKGNSQRWGRGYPTKIDMRATNGSPTAVGQRLPLKLACINQMKDCINIQLVIFFDVLYFLIHHVLELCSSSFCVGIFHRELCVCV